jgi:hypothetical protein
VTLAEGGVEGERVPELLAFIVEVFACGEVLLLGLAPHAPDALLLDLREDRVEGALYDLFALGFQAAFGKFYFFAGVFGVGEGLGQ